MKAGQFNMMMGGVLALGLGLGTPSFVQADTYHVDNAISDPTYHGGGSDHALWMPGLDGTIGSDFRFLPGMLGTFTENPDGTASLTGMVFSENDNSKGWNLNITLSGRTNNVLPGSPKKELSGNAYDPGPGGIDPDTWHYYGEDPDNPGTSSFMGSFIGTLEGKGAYAGAELELMGFGANLQVGEGANGKNLNYGLSGWFTWTVTKKPDDASIILNSRPTLERLGSRDHGDFNLDLHQTPEPSSYLLFGSGLAALGYWKRRKLQKA